jgi:hypothetical protein
LIEAENDLVPIGYELAAKAIDIGLAGLPLVRGSLLLGRGGDGSKHQNRCEDYRS